MKIERIEDIYEAAICKFNENLRTIGEDCLREIMNSDGDIEFCFIPEQKSSILLGGFAGMEDTEEIIGVRIKLSLVPVSENFKIEV